ncbi:hypothetical protein COP1_038682 [Malus domestica]
MAGFFSIRSGSDDQCNRNNQNSDDHHHIAPETLFCYKNEDVANQSYQDFELWKQQKQLLQTQQPWLYQSHTKLNSKVSFSFAAPFLALGIHSLNLDMSKVSFG